LGLFSSADRGACADSGPSAKTHAPRPRVLRVPPPPNGPRRCGLPGVCIRGFLHRHRARAIPVARGGTPWCGCSYFAVGAQSLYPRHQLFHPFFVFFSWGPAPENGASTLATIVRLRGPISGWRRRPSIGSNSGPGAKVAGRRLQTCANGRPAFKESWPQGPWGVLPSKGRFCAWGKFLLAALSALIPCPNHESRDLGGSQRWDRGAPKLGMKSAARREHLGRGHNKRIIGPIEGVFSTGWVEW